MRQLAGAWQGIISELDRHERTAAHVQRFVVLFRLINSALLLDVFFRHARWLYSSCGRKWLPNEAFRLVLVIRAVNTSYPKPLLKAMKSLLPHQMAIPLARRTGVTIATPKRTCLLEKQQWLTLWRNLVLLTTLFLVCMCVLVCVAV